MYACTAWMASLLSCTAFVALRCVALLPRNVVGWPVHASLWAWRQASTPVVPTTSNVDYQAIVTPAAAVMRLVSTKAVHRCLALRHAMVAVLPGSDTRFVTQLPLI